MPLTRNFCTSGYRAMMGMMERVTAVAVSPSAVILEERLLLVRPPLVRFSRKPAPLLIRSYR